MVKVTIMLMDNEKWMHSNMTQEEKADAYDKAIERAKQLCGEKYYGTKYGEPCRIIFQIMTKYFSQSDKNLVYGQRRSFKNR